MEKIKIHDIIGRMIRADHRHRAVCDRELAFLGLHRSQLRMLMHLWDHDGTMIQRELADELHISAAVVTVTVKKLEEGGYITRMPSEEDKRIFMISLTVKGRETVDVAHGILDRVDAAMMKDFTIEELQQLSSFYARMLANLSGTGEVTEP